MRRVQIVAAVLALGLGSVGCSTVSGTEANGGRPIVAVYPDVGRPAKQIAPGMVNKLARGMVNVVTCVVEIPWQTYKGCRDGVPMIKHKGLSRTTGFIKGLVFTGPSHLVGRAGSGAVEMATFWAANRPDNAGVGIPLDHEYAWEMGKPHDLMKPSLKEGVKPMGRKFAHGLADGAFGWLEFPGQIVRGTREKNIPKGIAKGFCYTISRTATGFADLGLFLFPNPKDTCGKAWNETWPWGSYRTA